MGIPSDRFCLSLRNSVYHHILVSILSPGSHPYSTSWQYCHHSSLSPDGLLLVYNSLFRPVIGINRARKRSLQGLRGKVVDNFAHSTFVDDFFPYMFPLSFSALSLFYGVQKAMLGHIHRPTVTVSGGAVVFLLALSKSGSPS